ncbi:asparaginase [Limibacter armeniacum]|uniref:asparaginase n=1 Tax=Limibacter armeniacum TaxID=466084 RepID=UPI002FE64C60
MVNGGNKYYKTVNINTTSPNESETSILIIYTGGTIGMDADIKSKSLVPFDFEKIIDKVPELKRFDFQLTVISLEPLIDSSNIKASHWATLASLVEEFYDEFDSFVILHGTDTMAYSASALSYMLDNLQKPVIFTGAQLPIGMPRTDARENLIASLEMAAARDENGEMLIKEVCICFNNVLLRGNRSKKVQSVNFTAFKSYNYPALAEAGIHIEYNEVLLWKNQSQELMQAFTEMDENVVIIKLFPGMTHHYLEAILSIPGLKGVVLETYGSGNTPTDDWLIDSLKRAIDRGIVIVNISQCTGGYVLQGRYETSVHLEEIGVIGGGDMTTEAAITKLMYLFGRYKDRNKVKILMKKSLRGEISHDHIQ